MPEADPAERVVDRREPSLADPQQELIDELRWQWRLEELEERREWREENL
jgi:hypothetical protein